MTISLHRPTYGRVVTVAVSVEVPSFIVIGRSSLEGCGFDSSLPTGQFSRFNTRPVMYDTVGSLASSEILDASTWAQFPLAPLNLTV